MLYRDEGIMQWAEDHNCKFGINKFKLVDFTRDRKKKGTEKRTNNNRGQNNNRSGNNNQNDNNNNGINNNNNDNENRNNELNKGVEIEGKRIKPEEHTRFLGVLIDSELRWNQQHAVMVKRGQEWITQFRRIARIKDGMAAKNVAQLWKAKAIPRMLYRADVVLAPAAKTKNRHWTHGKNWAVTSKLTSIQ